MRISARGNLIVETVAVGVRVMRFARPDLRPYLDDDGDAATSPLFREIQRAVLSDLAEGGTLVVNMGLIDPINAAFYRCLLGVRERVQAHHSRLVLCGLSAQHREIFDLFRGPWLFTIVSTEVEACRVARRARAGERRDTRCCRGLAQAPPSAPHAPGGEDRRLMRGGPGQIRLHARRSLSG